MNEIKFGPIKDFSFINECIEIKKVANEWSYTIKGLYPRDNPRDKDFIKSQIEFALKAYNEICNAVITVNEEL